MSNERDPAAESERILRGTDPCPGCGDICPKHRELRNHDLMWHEGDIVCTECEALVRHFDAD